MTTDTEQLAADIKRVMELDARHKKERSKWYAESHLCLQADIIRKLTDIVRAQHEALMLGQQFDDSVFWGESGERNKRAAARGYRRKRKAVLALSAPLVKEV
ncbi:MAG: hypothetical protein ACK5XN_30740 [Bacteroidota bacterium]